MNLLDLASAALAEFERSPIAPTKAPASIPSPATALDPDDDPAMRTCRQCANLAPGGHCLAAWRGEDFGSGIAVRRDFAPLDPDRPQRCLPYCPNPDDSDPRTGVERWSWLM